MIVFFSVSEIISAWKRVSYIFTYIQKSVFRRHEIDVAKQIRRWGYMDTRRRKNRPRKLRDQYFNRCLPEKSLYVISASIYMYTNYNLQASRQYMSWSSGETLVCQFLNYRPMHATIYSISKKGNPNLACNALELSSWWIRLIMHYMPTVVKFNLLAFKWYVLCDIWKCHIKLKLKGAKEYCFVKKSPKIDWYSHRLHIFPLKFSPQGFEKATINRQCDLNAEAVINYATKLQRNVKFVKPIRSSSFIKSALAQTSFPIAA